MNLGYEIYRQWAYMRTHKHWKIRWKYALKMSKTSLSSLLTVSILDTGCPGLYPWGIRLDDSFKTVTLECGPQTEGCSEKSPWNKKKFHNYIDMIWWINNFHHKFDSFPSLKIFLMRMMVIKPIVIFWYYIMRCINIWKTGITVN